MSEKYKGADIDGKDLTSGSRKESKIERFKERIEKSKFMTDLSLEVDPGDIKFSKETNYLPPTSKFDSEGNFAQGQSLEYYYCNIRGRNYPISSEDYPPPSIFEKAELDFSGQNSSQRKKCEDAKKTLVWEWYIEKNLSDLERKISELKEIGDSLPEPGETQKVIKEVEDFLARSRDRWQARQEEIKPAQMFPKITSAIESLKSAGSDITNRIRSFRYRPKQLENNPVNEEYFTSMISVLEDFQEKISESEKSINDPALRTEARRILRQLKETPKFIESQFNYVRKWEEFLAADSAEEKSTGVFYHFEGGFDKMHGAKNDTFVIDVSGNQRRHDEIRFTGKTRKGVADQVGKKIWNKIEPEELVIEVIKKGDIPELLVHRRPSTSVTKEQKLFVKKLEEEYGVPPGTFGFDEEINIEREGKKELVMAQINKFLETRRVPQKYIAEIEGLMNDRENRIEDFLDNEGVVIASEDDLERWAYSLGEGSDYNRFPPGVFAALFSTNRAEDLGRIFHAGSVNPNPCFLLSETSLENDKLQFIVNKYRGKQNLHARIVKS
jgi:hypothetical protein